MKQLSIYIFFCFLVYKEEREKWLVFLYRFYYKIKFLKDSLLEVGLFKLDGGKDD